MQYGEKLKSLFGKQGVRSLCVPTLLHV